MNVDHRLRNPTLIPETNEQNTISFPFVGPPSKFSEGNSYQSPPISYQSSRSSTMIKPTYHSIIEENTLYITSVIEPYVKPIIKEDRHSINEYSLGSSLGSGKFGKVYKAYSGPNRLVVAIKVITKKPWNNQQFSMNQTMRQIQLWKARGLTSSLTGDEAVKLMNIQKCRWEIYVMTTLSNPYVISLKECLDSSLSKSIYIVNEWCNLGELKWKRQDHEQVHPQWEQVLPGCDHLTFVKKALFDLSQGLYYLRTKGIIHRDIKPSNILVDSNQGLLKISDFGCAILEPENLPFNDELLRNCFQAELNKIVGTPAFIAPELCKFEEAIVDDVEDGYKLDIWSLGITLCSLLHNELPFYGENEFDTYQKVLSTPLNFKLNGEFLNDLVVDRLLDKNPSSRINIEELTLVILPKDVKRATKVTQMNESTKAKRSKKSNNTVQNLFTKLLNFKSGKKKVFSEVQPLEKVRTVAQVSDSSIQPSDNFDDTANTPDTSSSTSSYEEPVQVTDFMESSGLPSANNLNSCEAEDNLKECKSQCNTGGEMNETVSILSISPMKIPTPIKALIRIKSSPRANKTNNKSNNISPLKNKQKKKESRINRLAHSSDIINFQKFIHPPKTKDVVSTTEDIQEYLKYADAV